MFKKIIGAIGYCFLIGPLTWVPIFLIIVTLWAGGMVVGGIFVYKSEVKPLQEKVRRLELTTKKHTALMYGYASGLLDQPLPYHQETLSLEFLKKEKIFDAQTSNYMVKMLDYCRRKK